MRSSDPRNPLVPTIPSGRSVRNGPGGRRSGRGSGARPPRPSGRVPNPASAAMDIPRRSACPTPVPVAAVAALATLASAAFGLPWSAAVAQTMNERARSAAEASRSKAGDSDALRTNYLTSALAGEAISTVDDSRTFAPNIACQKTATLLEVMVQPGATGDLSRVTVARDTDLDGTVDTTAVLPVPISGICANGVVSCTLGTWDQCRFLRWNVDGAQALSLAPAPVTALAGCYCINASCGSNLAWGNMPSLLRDLGGGMIGALTSADPRHGIVEAVVDGPTIRYVGAQSTACSTSPGLPQTGYRASPAAMASDAYAASRSSSIFQALEGSAIGTGTTQQYRHCRIERQVSISGAAPASVIARTGGGYATQQTDTGFDFLMGSPANDSLSGGRCSIFDFRMTLHVADAARISEARLAHYFADDWAQVRVDDELVTSGPSNWTGTGLPPGNCETRATFHRYPGLDLRPFLTNGDHEIWLRVAVADGGEAFAQVHVEVDASCRTSEQLVDGCSTVAADAQCRLDTETVDGVQTWLNGVATGLRPLAQTRLAGGSSCPTSLTRDFFQKDRTYRCASTSLPSPDTSRGAYIIDRSTETMLADRILQANGTLTTSQRLFTLPDRGSVPACEPICKTRTARANTAVAADGVVGSRLNDPTGYDTFYHACTSDNRCPAEVGEEIVSPCGCLDDFPEAAVMMQTIRLAGADLVCTAHVP